MDDISAFNQSRWDALVRAGVIFSRPLLRLTPETARSFLDPYGMLGDVTGHEVLCLAAAGGQQSAAFAVLGARPHVLDLSTAMLERDKEVAAHYGAAIKIQQGDMRDLSRYADDHFDIVWQPYSINFVPDAGVVFNEVARVLKPGGFYQFQFHNPFYMGLYEAQWTGDAYPLRMMYEHGGEIYDPAWTFEDEQGQKVEMPGPRAFRHALGPVLTGLAARGFILLGLWEELGQAEDDVTPGTWEHFVRVAPPWLTVWCAFKPESMQGLPRGK